MSKKLLRCEVLEQRCLLSAASIAVEIATTAETSAALPETMQSASSLETLMPPAISSTSPAIDFFRLAPLGSLASSSQNNVGSLTEPATDEIDFTFFAEAGESIAAVAIPENPASQLTLEYVEGTGTIATAATPGGDVVLGPTGIVATGPVTLRVTGTLATQFRLDIYRNTALEALVGDSGAGNKVDLNASLLGSGVLPNGANRFAALAGTSLGPSQTLLYNEDFETAPGYTVNGLWHTSDGRSSDGQANHAGSALYFGQAEIATDFVGALNWVAELDSTNNNLWESTVNNSATFGQATQWSFDFASSPGTNGSASNLAGVHQWYPPGSSATMDSLEDSRSDAATQQDVSWELVFRPRDFSGSHVLFETGSNGEGTTFLLSGNTLEFRVQDADDATQRVQRSFTFDMTSDVDKFHHVVATVHPDATSAANSVRLFVNGIEAGSAVSATGILADWSGDDDAGLGAPNGGFADDSNTVLSGQFDGDIGVLRYHENRLLSQGEVKASFDDLVNDFAYRIGNYDTELAVAGDAASPTAGVALAGGTEYTLAFNTLIEVEDADEPFELMQVIVRDTTSMVDAVLLDRFDGGFPVTTNGQWVPIEADLSSFAGQTIQIIFRFDSVDETGNAFEGWWIDDVQITRSDPPATVDEDQFTIDLSSQVGQDIDILLAGQAGADYSGQLLELRNADKSILFATGVTDPLLPGTDATNYDLGILGYQVLEAGLYTIRVLSDSATIGQQYGIVVTDTASFETEPDGAGSPLRSLNNTLAGMGYLQSSGVQQYASRAAFDADHPSLAWEDFESGAVDDDDLTSLVGPLNSSTTNAAFPTGLATSGLTISAGALSTGDLALMGADFFDIGNPGSKVVGADSFSDDTLLSFEADVFAVGLEIFDDGDVEVTALDSNMAVIASVVVTAVQTGTFFGIASTTAIDQLVLTELGTPNGELVDNVAFGAAGVTPQPDDDNFRISLGAGQTVQVTTSTPLDDPSSSPRNDLDPKLEITGPGIVAPLTDTSAAGDGKNARLLFTAPQAGNFKIKVSPESGQGEYLVVGEFLFLIDGDFDGDANIDGADFLEWQRKFGILYDDVDLAAWEANYGVGSSGGLAGLSAAPIIAASRSGSAASQLAIPSVVSTIVVETGPIETDPVKIGPVLSWATPTQARRPPSFAAVDGSFASAFFGLRLARDLSPTHSPFLARKQTIDFRTLDDALSTHVLPAQISRESVGRESNRVDRESSDLRDRRTETWIHHADLALEELRLELHAQ